MNTFFEKPYVGIISMRNKTQIGQQVLKKLK